MASPSKDRVRPSFDDTTCLLRYLYADLTRISDVASKEIQLHPAGRNLSSPPKPPIKGVDAVQAHENALVKATGGSLVMDVESISANGHFGTVLGTLRARKHGAIDLAVPFCGVWRFDHGEAVEHWENAINPADLERWMRS
ncbi:hypothetical protein B0T25DRAFT_536934 [Lasiosphaeria hispida]|uniref:SnoaL-like domain-containing protein n=1 Tax=Lasiosphaeria hispida TaxID=260671 RepID=A0AAJ0HL29_9PEZI|nr:hypothetical protein B0T25DRAFT_536934 [Lasiosphaeria hispida]